MTRIRIAVGSCKPVKHPRQSPVIAYHDVGIGIESQKWRKRLHAILYVTAHQQQALRVNVVAERQLGQIISIEGDQNPAEKASEQYAPISFIGGHAVRLTLRVVEFLLMCLHVHVCAGQLSKVDLWPLYRQIGDSAL